MTQERCPIFRCTSRDGRFAFDILPGQSVRVGRSKEQSDFVIDSNMLSRLHAIFYNREGVCVLEYGLNTGSNMHVNGECVRKERHVKRGRQYQVQFLSDFRLGPIRCGRKP